MVIIRWLARNLWYTIFYSCYILFQLSDEGVLQRELNEKNVIEMIDEVTSKWPLLGLHLNVPKHKLDEFLLTHPHNLTQIKLSLISHWIRNDLEPSWRKLADALDRAEHRRLGEKIRKKYSIRPYSGGRAPTSPRSQTPSPLAVFHTRINPFSFPSPPPPPSVIVSFSSNQWNLQREDIMTGGHLQREDNTMYQAQTF